MSNEYVELVLYVEGEEISSEIVPIQYIDTAITVYSEKGYDVRVGAHYANPV